MKKRTFETPKRTHGGNKMTNNKREGEKHTKVCHLLLGDKVGKTPGRATLVLARLLVILILIPGDF